MDTIILIMQAGTLFIFGTMGEVLSQRSGVLNLGLEGMMVVGSLAGFAASYSHRQSLDRPCRGHDRRGIDEPDSWVYRNNTQAIPGSQRHGSHDLRPGFDCLCGQTFSDGGRASADADYIVWSNSPCFFWDWPWFRSPGLSSIEPVSV